jgi:hypothetical protein
MILEFLEDQICAKIILELKGTIALIITALKITSFSIKEVSIMTLGITTHSITINKKPHSA